MNDFEKTWFTVEANTVPLESIYTPERLNGMTPLERAYREYFDHVSDEEIQGYYSAYTKEEWLSDEFKAIRWILEERNTRNGQSNSYMYFYYRDLLTKKTDDNILKVALDKLIGLNEKAWKDYVGGKDQVIGRFIGLLSKETKASIEVTREYIESRRKQEQGK